MNKEVDQFVDYICRKVQEDLEEFEYARGYKINDVTVNWNGDHFTVFNVDYTFIEVPEDEYED